MQYWNSLIIIYKQLTNQLNKKYSKQQNNESIQTHPHSTPPIYFLFQPLKTITLIHPELYLIITQYHDLQLYQYYLSILCKFIILLSCFSQFLRHFIKFCVGLQLLVLNSFVGHLFFLLF